MPERTFSSPEYRYGFNGKEKDEEGEWGDLTHYDYGFRIYNPGVGRFLSVDPLTRSYPMLTPYQYASNSPIWMIDIDGLEGAPVTPGVEGQTASSSYESREDGSVSVNYVYHEGSDVAPAGWYGAAAYRTEVVAKIAELHGIKDGYAVYPEPAVVQFDASSDFSLGDYVSFDTEEQVTNWSIKYGETYSVSYSKARGEMARRFQGGLENNFIIFDILSLGSAKFWTSVVRVGATKALGRGGAKNLVNISFVKGPSSRKFGEHSYVIIDGKSYDFGIALRDLNSGTKLGKTPLWGQPTRLAMKDGEQVALNPVNSVVTMMVTREQADLALRKLVQISDDIAIGGSKCSYNILNNSCASNAKDVLNAAGQNIPSSAKTTNQIFNFLKNKE